MLHHLDLAAFSNLFHSIFVGSCVAHDLEKWAEERGRQGGKACFAQLSAKGKNNIA